MSKTMVDILLEEIEEELDSDFNTYLEDFNLSLMLENDQQQNTQQQNNTNNGQQQNTQQQNNTNNGQQQNNNQQQNQNSNGIMDRINKIFNQTDSFIAKYVGKIENGFKSVSNKIKGSETYKLADDISLEAIDFLSVPKQVCKAGDDLSYVLGSIDKWTGGLIGGLKTQGTNLKNTAKKGTQAKNNPTLLDGILKQCNNIIAGLNNAMGSVGQGFSSIWASIKKTFAGKQEHVFLTLEEEVDYLLEQDSNRVFLTLDEEVDYLLS